MLSFRSIKPHSNPTIKSVIKTTRSISSSKSPSSSSSLEKNSPSCLNPGSTKKNLWSVYLILSTNHPIKTYVGSTNNFSRRLKQHNGELVGGAKASRAGRPWVCACLVHGFPNKSKACEFESRWKIISKKLPRKRKSKEVESPGEKEEDGSLALLHHRNAALCKVTDLIDSIHLEIKWHFDMS